MAGLRGREDNSGEESDAALAVLALAGQEDAFRLLLARHRDAVYRLVHAQLADADAALDIVQESFIAAFAHLHRYDRARPFRHWVLRIAINKCRDWRRRRTVRSFFTRALPMEDGLQVADTAALPDEIAEKRQALAHVRAAIDRLPEGLRTILLLRTVEGMSQAEVAHLLGVNQKAVETRLYRARAKVQDMIEG